VNEPPEIPVTGAPTGAGNEILLVEYKAISEHFSSAFQTMAFLLALFFAYTAAVLTYISKIFGDIKLSDSPDLIRIFVDLDFRYLQIFAICIISLVFTFWSQCWVFIYPRGARMILRRAGKLEEYLSQAGRHPRFFRLYANWYRKDVWVCLLRWTTGLFFVFVYALYGLIAWYAEGKMVCHRVI
jgi:hypothetical protein